MKNGWKQLELLNFPSESESLESSDASSLDSLLSEVSSFKKKVSRKHPLKIMKDRLSGYGKNLSDFYKSSSNQEAWELSRAIIEKPGVHYPYVYFFSKPGLGKTHLLYGIAKEILKAHKNYRLYLTTGRELLERYKTLMSEGGLSVFLEEVTDNVDGLFIDDVEPCFEHGAFQRDFCLLFNNLKAAGKQLILTGNQSPEGFKKLGQRLAGRLSSLISSSLSDFDYNLSNTFANQFLRKHSIKEEGEFIEQLCKRWGANGYQLEGALSHFKLGYQIEKGVTKDMLVSLESKEGNEVPDRPSAQNEVVKVKEEDTKRFSRSIEGFSYRESELLRKVSEYFGVSLGDLLGQSRKKDFALPRHLSMYFLHCEEKLSLTRIAQLFKRDHTSILYASEKIKKAILKKDPEVDFHICALKEKGC